MKGQIVVLDIGTTTAKTLIFSMEGETLVTESVPFKFLDRPVNHYEQDPKVVFQAIIDATAKAVASTQEVLDEFNPLVVSMVCQGGSMIPCLNNGDNLYPMITWMDSRSKDITAKFAETGMDKIIHDKSGFLPSSGLPLSMILWMKEYEKEIFAKTEKWVCLNDYVSKKLTGNFVTNYSAAGLTQLFNMSTLDWDDELVAFADLRKEQLSDIKLSEEIVGSLLPEVARQMNLPENLPVVNGSHDRTAEAIGLGMYQTGSTWIGTGTAWVVCSVIDAKDVKDELTSNFHVTGEKRIASTLIGGLGTSVEWWLEQLLNKREGMTRSQILIEITKMASESPVGANGLIFKAFTGTGNEGTFLNETDMHTDGDRSRAVYEAIAFDFKKEYEEFAQYVEMEGKLTLVGGATRSTLWPTIIAEILGSEIAVSQYPHDPSLGAAILGAKFIGIKSTYEEIFKIFETDKVALIPNQEHVEQYKELYKKRLKLIS